MAASSESSRAPAIQTERLLLRGHRRDDLAACASLWADPLVTRFTLGRPSSKQQTWARLLAYVGHWALLGFGYWAVVERSTDSVVGELGFADFERGLAPSLQGLPELGWAFASHVHGQGFATEALRAAVAWGDAQLASKRTICLIDPENVASLRVARKCGYEVCATLSQSERPTLVFMRP